MEFKNVSIIETGPAEGHGFNIDQKTLESLVAKAPAIGVPVRVDHSNSLANIVGTVRGFRISGNRVLGDLTLLSGASFFEHAKSILKGIPNMFGFSILGSGSLEEIGDQKFFRLGHLYAADLVTFPAANTGGVFGTALSVPAGMFRLASVHPSNQSVNLSASVAALRAGGSLAPNESPLHGRTLTRAEFATLSTAEKSAFCVRGGRLTDPPRSVAPIEPLAPGAKTATREQFQTLSPEAKMSFSKSGGRIL